MSSSLGFSEISNGENIKDIYKPKNNHKKTIKNTTMHIFLLF